MPKSDHSTLPSRITLDLNSLWTLLPRKIPGRVKWLNSEGTYGLITVDIPALYPNGEPIRDVDFRNTNGLKVGDEVVFEWEEALPSKKDGLRQPHLIQVTHVEISERYQIERITGQYHELLGASIQRQLKQTLELLQKERENVPKIVEQQVVEAQKKLAKQLKKHKQRLAERENQVQAAESELAVRRAQLEAKVRAEMQIILEEELAKRRQELDRREGLLNEREKHVESEGARLKQAQHELEAERNRLLEEQSRFEAAGGKAYLEYVRAITWEDASPPQTIEPADEAINLYFLSGQLAERGYEISSRLLRQAIVATIAAWSAGQFVVLSGPTGVGKTQLVRQLSNLLGAGHGIIAVRPGWVEPSDLFGFYNPMHKLFEPAPALDHLLCARQYAEKDRFYILCLDEMNLSRIENYAADFLSLLEQRGAGETAFLDLYSQAIAARLQSECEKLCGRGDSLNAAEMAYRDALARQLHNFPPRFKIPRSLVVFGTVNVDETTLLFSPKFLDRAYVLRFPPIELPETFGRLSLTGDNQSALWPLPLTKAEALLKLEESTKEFDALWQTFRVWQSDYLARLDIHFGHRFQANLQRYVNIGLNLGVANVTTLGQDYYHAKVLPRIRFAATERVDVSTAKIEVLQKWIDNIQSDRRLRGQYVDLHQSLREMVKRGESRGMVEYWD